MLGVDWGECVKNGIATIQCIPILLQNVITDAFAFVGLVALIFVIWAGIKFISSGGDAKQTGEARKILTYAILGLVLILLSIFILHMIAYFTDTPCILKFGFEQCNNVNR
jgi:hypothetical protein